MLGLLPFRNATGLGSNSALGGALSTRGEHRLGEPA